MVFEKTKKGRTVRWIVLRFFLPDGSLGVVFENNVEFTQAVADNVGNLELFCFPGHLPDVDKELHEVFLERGGA